MTTSSSIITSTLLLNLTPHNIMVYPPDTNNIILYPRGGTVARLRTDKQQQLTSLEDGTPVYTPQHFSGIVPENNPTTSTTNIGVIVSMPVAEWLADSCAWQTQVYVADTGPDGAIRNEDGIIIGTKRLNRYK